MMHTNPMRTTVTLDQEAYELATLYSKGRGVTLGAALSELSKKGIEALRAEPRPSPRLKRLPAKDAIGVLIRASIELTFG